MNKQRAMSIPLTASKRVRKPLDGPNKRHRPVQDKDSANDNLCAPCSMIDFSSICDPKNGSTYRYGQDVVDLGERLEHSKGSRCRLCRLFAAQRIQSAYTKNYAIRAISNLWIFPWVSSLQIPNEFKQQETILLAVVPKLEGESVRSSISEVEKHSWQQGYLSVIDSCSTGFQGRIVTKTADYPLYKEWINYCQRNHCKTCDSSPPSSVSGLKVIDCETLRIVLLSQSEGAYVALSYVWGNVPAGDGTCKTHSKLPEDHPTIITDAITVTRGLGFNYLWVDRYCIDQTNSKEKHDQIGKMHLIYAGAEVTIIAAAGDDGEYGLPGVGKRPRFRQPVAKVENKSIVSTLGHPIQDIESSKWSTRGWTYQEAVLSKRRLAFTDHQVYFECNEMNTYESFSAPLNVLHGKDKSEFHAFLRPHVFHDTTSGGWGPDSNAFLSDKPALSHFTAHVENFSGRQLRYESDILKAFTGIAQALKIRQEDTPVVHLWGLPFELIYKLERIRDRYDTYKLGSVRTGNVKSFIHSLQWYFLEPGFIRRKEFPSWSWAGWKNCVGFHSANIVNTSFGQGSYSHPVHILIALNDGSKSHLSDLTATFLDTHEQRITPILHFEGWVIRFPRSDDLLSLEDDTDLWNRAQLTQDSPLACLILNSAADDPIPPSSKSDSDTFELLFFCEEDGIAYREGAGEIKCSWLSGRSYSMAIETIRMG